MIIKNCTIVEFEKRVQSSSVVCFGAGRYMEDFSEGFPDVQWNIAYFVDNNEKLWGQKKILRGVSYDICSPSFLFDNITKNTVLLISCGYDIAPDIFKELDSDKRLKAIECYLAHAINATQTDYLTYNATLPPIGFRMNEQQVIPKIIHYCWFGHGEIPEWNQKCMESWRKFCPDYEIIAWNEKNYDVTKNRYMYDAYKAKKWGFVPDYARLDIIYEHGGIYLDVDVELVRPLDELLYNDAFCGFDKATQIAFGLGFGAVVQFPLLVKMMGKYENSLFINDDGSYNLEPSPAYQTEVIEKCGLVLNGGFQVVDGMAVYPAEFLSPFSPLTFNMWQTKNTHAIHWFDASWHTELQHDTRRFWRELMDRARKNERGEMRNGKNTLAQRVLILTI